MNKGILTASVLAFVLSLGMISIAQAAGDAADCSKIEDAAKKAECEKAKK